MVMTPHLSVADEKAETKKRPASVGERVFDFTVYGLMNWVGTFVITVPIAWGMQYSKAASPLFNKAASKLEGGMPWLLRKVDWVLSPIRKVPPAAKMADRAQGAASNFLMTCTTMQGGNIMLIPIKWAENRKIKAVAAINRMVGDTTDPSTVEAVPKQTWGSLIKGRLTAFAVVWLTFTGASMAIPKTFGAFAEEFGHAFAKWFKGKSYGPNLPAGLLEEQAVLRATATGEKALSRLKAVSETIAKHETWQFQMGKIASWDTIATTAAVILLYAGSKFFARKNDEKTETKALKARALSQAPAESARREEPKVREQPGASPRMEILAASASAEKALTASPSLGA